MEADKFEFHFRAKALRVIDGDTLEVEVDCGFHSRHVERVRLKGVNCPEMKGSAKALGEAAKGYVELWLSKGRGEWPLSLRTYKTDSFGRYLADVTRRIDGAELARDLLDNGYASES